MGMLSQTDYNDRRALESALTTINLQIEQTQTRMRDTTAKDAKKAGRQLAQFLVRRMRLLDEYQRFNRTA